LFFAVLNPVTCHTASAHLTFYIFLMAKAEEGDKNNIKLLGGSH
jgi:hypothetical protein